MTNSETLAELKRKALGPAVAFLLSAERHWPSRAAWFEGDDDKL